MKRFFSILITCVLIAGFLAMPAEAIAHCEPDTQAIVRATDQFAETISTHAVMTLGASVSLDSGETVSYNCSYTPRDANVMFGYIGPDGYFYGLSGSDGTICKGIRVSKPGSYTLAIWNKSDTTVTVTGTVNY